MTKEEFLTVRWNNILTLGVGLPGLIYIVAALSSSVWSTRAGFIGLVFFGVIYWISIDLHTSMRFAWQRKNSAGHVSSKLEFTDTLNRIVFLAFNAVFWLPILLTFFGAIDYGTGFILFTMIIFVRLVANLYINNVLELTPEQFENFPFRIPWIVER
jgi:hypothetical protein